MKDFIDLQIIGITGTQGAGKDTVAEFLMQKLGFEHLSLSDIVRDETSKMGLEQNRDNWREVADSLRAKFGNGVMAVKMIEKITCLYLDDSEKKGLDVKGVIITSFRHPDEVDIIKKRFSYFKLINIDAPIETRYERILKRGKAADKVTLAKFRKQEEKENVKGNVGMRIREVQALADITIINDGDINNLYNQVRKIL